MFPCLAPFSLYPFPYPNSLEPVSHNSFDYYQRSFSFVMNSEDRAFRARNHAPSSSQVGRAETGDKKDGLEMNHSTRSGCPAKSRDSLGNMHRAARFEICQRQPVSVQRAKCNLHRFVFKMERCCPVSLKRMECLCASRRVQEINAIDLNLVRSLSLLNDKELWTAITSSKARELRVGCRPEINALDRPGLTAVGRWRATVR